MNKKENYGIVPVLSGFLTQWQVHKGPLGGATHHRWKAFLGPGKLDGEEPLTSWLVACQSEFLVIATHCISLRKQS